MKKAFVSFNFKNKNIVFNFMNTIINVQGDVILIDLCFVKNDVSMLGESMIDKEIKSVMTDCEWAIFLIGNDNHNSPWIKREAELAASMNIKRIAIRLPNTTGGLPDELRNVKLINWNRSEIKIALF